MLKRIALSVAAICATSLAGPASAIDFEVGENIIEVTGFVKNKTSFFTREGEVTGARKSVFDTNAGHNRGDLLKFENQIRIFLNGELGENMSWHSELAAIYDTEGVNSDFKGHKLYTQNDWFRELYVDTSVGPVDLRIGKQQQVWGTADGIKLLDILNPTDFREIAENGIEETRLPVWMLAAETEVGESGNVQMIISRHEEHKIAGLNAGGAAGHPYIFKGVDTITGPVNGFVNIAPALGLVSSAFQQYTANFVSAVFLPTAPPGVNPTPGFTTAFGNKVVGMNISPLNGLATLALHDIAPTTVYEFVNGISLAGVGSTDLGINPSGLTFPPAKTGVAGGTHAGALFATACNSVGFQNVNNNSPSLSLAGNRSSGNAACLNALAQNTGNSFLGVGGGNGGPTAVPLGGNNNVTNLLDGGQPQGPVARTAFNVSLIDPTAASFIGQLAFWDQNNPNSAIEYFPDAKFGTFDSFVNIQTQYRREYASKSNPNFGLRYRGSLPGGNTNFSLNYLYAYDSFPSVSIQVETPDGIALEPYINDGTTGGTTKAGVPLTWTGGQTRNDPLVLTYHDPATGAQRCSAQTGTDIVVTPGVAGGPGCKLAFIEKTHRLHNIGASFDTAFDAMDLPFTLRGEFLYQPDIRWPVIDRGQLAIGNLTEALKPVKQDHFKYVIGLDTVVLTNLYISTQFIQFINLDFVDKKSPLNARINAERAPINTTESNIQAVIAANNAISPGTSGTYDKVLGVADYEVYSADLPSLSINNGLKKGQEYKAFVSLFISKPFGPSMDGRWNLLTIYEEEGGWWNRLDAEYSFSDELVGHAQWNHYYGSRTTLFGQFANSSNIQLSMKYLFE